MKSYSGGIRHDYKDGSSEAGAFSARGILLFAVGFLLPLLAVALVLVSEPNESMVPAEAPLEAKRVLEPDKSAAFAILPATGEPVALELPPLARVIGAKLPRPHEIEQNALLARGEALTLVVKRNDTLDRLFRRNDLSIADLDAMVDLENGGSNLGKIHIGDKIEIIRDGRNVLSLRKALSDSQELWIRQEGEGYTAQLIDLDVEIRTAGASGVIDSGHNSLYLAASAAGMDDDVTMQITGIFEWDIDFFLDVRLGDSFTVVYEEKWRDGEKLGNGDIVAAEFVNRGRSYRAARYVDADGFVSHFTPEGLNVKKQFLRNPIEFTSRVSSSFSLNRRHPILNTIRAHRGVDLAAPTGTEIRAAGNGKIIARGAYGSFGNRIEIQHGGNITTLYAHMSRFGDFRVGDRVEQGDVIGYVGMTGGATGPHLHYEYRVNGVHQNPQTVELPDGEPIAKEYLADFEAASKPLWHQLDLYKGPLLAEARD